MNKELKVIKVGLALVLFGLLFGVIMGMTFGINEDIFKNYITEGIAANPTVHDAKSPDKIWRYAQRAHFHATGIAAFALGLVFLVMFSDLKPKMKEQFLSFCLAHHVCLSPFYWTGSSTFPCLDRDICFNWCRRVTSRLFFGPGQCLFGVISRKSNILLRICWQKR
jgi:hypothetical protein